MAVKGHRGGHQTQWLIAALVVAVMVSGGGVVWLLVTNARSASAIRIDAEKSLLISDMEDAVQVESERVGHLAGQLMGASIGMGASMDTNSADGTAASGLLLHDPAVLGAITAFGETAGSLRQLVSASENGLLDEVVGAHDGFVASMAELDGLIDGGTAAMSFYHGTTQMLEAELRTSLDELQRTSNNNLQETIAGVRRAETLSRWALPLLLLAGVAAAVYLLRMQGPKRRMAGLESLIDAKNEFIGAVSHELRNPLTGIVGFTDVLRETENDLSQEDRASILATISVQSQEVASIVEDLLVAARTDIGELTVIAVPVNLRAQTAQILELHEQSAGQRISLTGEAPKAIGDPARVRQILRNLLSNAVRYGGSEISIELGGRDMSALVRVKDNGSLIPQEDRSGSSKPISKPAMSRALPGRWGSAWPCLGALLA